MTDYKTSETVLLGRWEIYIDVNAIAIYCYYVCHGICRRPRGVSPIGITFRHGVVIGQTGRLVILNS